MKKMTLILFTLFVYISVIIPSDVLNIKKILFFLLIFINIKLLVKLLAIEKNLIYIVFGFIFPTILIVYSIFLTLDPINSFLRGYAPYIFLLVPIVKYYKINIEKILIYPIWGVTLVILIIAGLDFFNIIGVNENPFALFLNKSEVAAMGASVTYPFYYKLFYKTSPLISILLFKYFYEKKYFCFILAALATVCSGTRANIGFFTLCIIIYYLFFYKEKSRLLKYIITLGSIIAITICIYPLYKQLDLMFWSNSVSSTSNNIRVGHIKGLIKLVKDNPLVIFFGTGMGSSFYSYGRNEMVSVIEVQHLDLWRQMGLGLYSAFIVFLIIPLFYKNKNGYYKKFVYVSYLLVAATNPLLFSSTAYIIYIYIYYDLTKKTQKGSDVFQSIEYG